MPERKNWILAFLLSSPIILFFLANLFHHDPNLIATGFIQYDNVTYAGNAIQYTWREHHGLFYANRLNDSFDSPQIYFNPQILILAGLMKLGMPPGISIMLFTLLCAIVFFRIIISIYDSITNTDKFRIRNIILISWGGGLLCASGLLSYVLGITRDNFLTSLFVLDPAHGWWGLNLGRSLFFSLEAWYHLLFFTIVLCILKRKWTLASFLLLILSTSHPFTGIELLLILLAWAIMEILINKKNVPVAFIIALISILAFHIWYYLVFLNRFPEHYAVYQQYSLNWRYRFYHFIPAYILTFILVALTLRIEGFRNFLSNKNNRLFMCWGLVAFALANHELFMTPMQPIHFTRGYIWSALFLAGLPALNYIWEKFSRTRRTIIYISIVFLVFLSDNLLWIWKNSRRVNEQTPVSHITKAQDQILDFLSRNTGYGDMIVGSDNVIPYLASVRTKANIWISHVYNTPFYAIKNGFYKTFIESGHLPLGWNRLTIFFIVDNSNNREINFMSSGQADATEVFRSGSYSIYSRKPSTGQSQPAQGDADQ